MDRRIVAVGEPFRGDDGVGFVVTQRIEARAKAAGVSVHYVRDAAALEPILERLGEVLIIDAVASQGTPGRVLLLRPEDITSGDRPVSSHGLSVMEAIQLARVLGRGGAPHIEILGITIRPQPAIEAGLSPEVEAAVDEAVAAAARWAGLSPETPEAPLA